MEKSPKNIIVFTGLRPEIIYLHFILDLTLNDESCLRGAQWKKTSAQIHKSGGRNYISLNISIIDYSKQCCLCLRDGVIFINGGMRTFYVLNVIRERQNAAIFSDLSVHKK